MTIDYTAYIEAQTNLATCKERVRTFQKRLDILLKHQAPSPINSQSYDRPDLLAECEAQRKAIDGAFYDVNDWDDLEIIEEIRKETL